MAEPSVLYSDVILPHSASSILPFNAHALALLPQRFPLMRTLYICSLLLPSFCRLNFFKHSPTRSDLAILHRPVRMMKIVLKLSVEDESSKRKALKLAAGVQGVDSVAVDMKEKKMTVIGDVDPVYLASKLRKFGFTELLSLGPAKEEKKDEKKPQGDAKKENKADAPKYEVVYVPSSYYPRPYEYTVVSDENPNACVIC